MHKARVLPKEQFRHEVEKELTGKDSGPSELIYFKMYKSQIPVIEQAIETASLMLGRVWNEAQVNRDADALDSLVDSRFVNAAWDRVVSDKHPVSWPTLKTLFRPSLLTIRDVKMNFFGNTAVIAGIYHAQGTYKGKSYDHVGRFTDTWVLDGAKWQCVASHTNLLKN